MLEIRPLATAHLPELGRLFCSDRSAGSCWCMWFIISVKEYHRGGSPANAGRFRDLAANSAHPLGLIAWLDGEPVGWAAAGPRSRYARAVRTPTLKGVDQSRNDDVWLVPCFFIRPGMRGRGLARRLLEHAVELARASDASAIEGFPTSGSRRGSADQQVGTERLFESCGFAAVSRPSSNRVVMHLDLAIP